MDALTTFGLFSVGMGLVFYAFEDRSHWCILGFALACFLGSIYGFLQGAWPFGLVEGVWTVVAIRRWLAFQREKKDRYSSGPSPSSSGGAAGVP